MPSLFCKLGISEDEESEEKKKKKKDIFSRD